MRLMCNNIAHDYGIKISGDPKNVNFNVVTNSIEIFVDWDMTNNNGYTLNDIKNTNILDLVNDVASAIQIWYNLTGTETCIAWNGENKAVDEKNLKESIIDNNNVLNDNICTKDKIEFTPGI